jgi:hypothetical protein
VFLSGTANPQNFQVSTTFAGFTWPKSVIFIKKRLLTPPDPLKMCKFRQSDPLKMCGFSFFYPLKMRNRLLKTYLFVGGMPAVINEYLKSGDFGKVRKVQNGILEGYDRDFSKYAKGSFSSKLRMLWQSIPSQLAKENKKFT